MEILYILTLLAWGSAQVQAKAVFAHFMVGNTQEYSLQEWQDDISAAQEAHIDAFALNMANNELYATSIANAFATAKDLGFSLFFSFDYAGNGSWPMNQTIDLMNQYKDHPAYYQYDSKPFMSTFEGATSPDWPTIKNATGSFFIPDWSSVGPFAAANNSFIDGLFSWAAWPNGPTSMNTSSDQAYIDALDGRPYMMPVSPWFYTNMPGFDKNWVWRGDNLWYDRWQQVLDLEPEFVEIISWNDYGESHYIGPLHDNAYIAFEQGDAPYNYATNMTHDGWRKFLPYVIDQYKNPNGSIAITKEDAVAWYRLHPASACTTGGTTGNSPSQGQIEYPPSEIVEDRIFFSALLNSTADITVTIGKNKVQCQWTNIPTGGNGIYHGSVPFSSAGNVKVSISRNNHVIASITGEPITSDCPVVDKGIQDYNAWVGTSSSMGCNLSLSTGMGVLSLCVVILAFISDLSLF